MSNDFSIFADSDGVLHNFDGHFASYNQGRGPKDVNPETGKPISDDDMWAIIETVPLFWLTMPLMPDAQALHDGIKHYNPVVLSGCPKVNYHQAVDYKRQKFARNFPGMPVLTCPSKYKPIAAAVHLEKLDARYLQLAEDVFLGKLEEPALTEARADLKNTMAGLDLTGAVLIDDMKKNCLAFTKARGHAILFRSTQQALEDLRNERFFQIRTK